MNTKTVAALAIAGILSAGCALWERDKGKMPMAAPNPNLKCEVKDTVCHITVRVSQCRVTVEPDWTAWIG